MPYDGHAICPLSVVIPVDLQRRPRDLLAKLLHLARFPGMEQLKLVIAHNDRAARHDRALVRQLSMLPHVTLVSDAFYPGAVNNGYLRNRAVEKVETAKMLLLDADLHPDPGLFIDSARLLSSRQEKVVMLPCLYLTKWASDRLRGGRETPATILNGYFSFRRRYFQHMASPSSIVLLRTQDFRDLGGFDERYDGHGYEDFDFMLRLAMHHALIPRSEELLDNQSYRAPLLAVGFRKHLGRLSLPRLLERKVVLHLHHDKPPGDDYYLARNANAVRLLHKLKGYVEKSTGEPASREFLVDEFFAGCRERGIDARDYLVLFDTRPGHVDRLCHWTERMKYVLGLH